LREPVMNPDVLIIQDPTLLTSVNVFEGFGESGQGYVLVNSRRPLEELGLGELLRRLPSGHAHSVPASDLAKEHLGRPLPNAVLLGAFSALTGQVQLASVEAAIRERFPGSIGERNVAAARAAFALLAPSSTPSAPLPAPPRSFPPLPPR